MCKSDSWVILQLNTSVTLQRNTSVAYNVTYLHNPRATLTDTMSGQNSYDALDLIPSCAHGNTGDIVLLSIIIRRSNNVERLRKATGMLFDILRHGDNMIFFLNMQSHKGVLEKCVV